jgi:predicted Fe-Mo cluster-binding NifX family protein
METIAITFWNGLVSPLFDAAATALIVGPDNNRRQIAMNNATLYAKADLLRQHETNVVICGAISATALTVLQERGMRVIPWIRGSIEEVLLAYGNGSLETDSFFMPGCHRKGRCRGRRRVVIGEGREQCRRPMRKVMDADLPKGR